jgi:hypothetical protein
MKKVTNVLKILSPDHERDYRIYTRKLLDVNISFQAEVRKAIRELYPRSKDFAVLTTGSDGRYEKGPYHTSRLELIVLFKKQEDQELLQEIKEFNDYSPEVFFEDLEIKCVEKDSMSNFRNDHTRVFPTRILDGVLLDGSELIRQKAREKIFGEFLEESGKSILGRLKRKKLEFKSVLEKEGESKFKGEKVNHYQINDSEVISNFDPDNYLLSFKTGPLRVVQYTLAKELIREYRETKKENREQAFKILNNLPKNIPRRISHLRDNKMLNISEETSKDLEDAYRYFLWAYNLAQERYQKYNEKQTAFDKKEVKSRIDTIMYVLSQNETKPLISLHQ